MFADELKMPMSQLYINRLYLCNCAQSFHRAVELLLIGDLKLCALDLDELKPERMNKCRLPDLQCTKNPWTLWYKLGQALVYRTSFDPFYWKKILKDMWNKITIVELPLVGVCRRCVNE